MDQKSEQENRKRGGRCGKVAVIGGSTVKQNLYF